MTGYVYEIELKDPLPAGLSLLDPIQEIARQLPSPLDNLSYLHDGKPTLLIELVRPTGMSLQSYYIPPPPGGGTAGLGGLGRLGLDDAGNVAIPFLLSPLGDPFGLNSAVFRYSHSRGALSAAAIPGASRTCRPARGWATTAMPLSAASAYGKIQSPAADFGPAVAIDLDPVRG